MGVKPENYWALATGGLDPVLDGLFGHEKRVVARGKALTSEGDDSHKRFYVSQGWLAVSKSLKNGEQHILEVILPGETFDPTAADGKTSFVKVEALCDAVVISIDRTVWTRLLRDSPELWHAENLKDVAAQARQSERILRLAKSRAETRIAYVLIEMCLRLSAFGATSGCAFHMPLGQQKLGEFTGLSSVHVCRTLRRLVRQGIVTTGDHMDVVIHHMAALADLAGVDIAALRRAIIPEGP